MVEIVTRPYAAAFEAHALANPDVLCLSADLTSSCEIDGFREGGARHIGPAVAEELVAAFLAAAVIAGAAAAVRVGLVPRRPLVVVEGGQSETEVFVVLMVAAGLIGFVLAGNLEQYLFISVQRYGFDWLTRPGVIIMAVIIAASLGASIVYQNKLKAAGRTAPKK